MEWNRETDKREKQRGAKKIILSAHAENGGKTETSETNLRLAQRTRLVRVRGMEIGHGFGSVNFVGRDPASLFVSAFIT